MLCNNWIELWPFSMLSIKTSPCSKKGQTKIAWKREFYCNGLRVSFAMTDEGVWGMFSLTSIPYEISGSITYRSELGEWVEGHDGTVAPSRMDWLMDWNLVGGERRVFLVDTWMYSIDTECWQRVRMKAMHCIGKLGTSVHSSALNLPGHQYASTSPLSISAMRVDRP